MNTLKKISNAITSPAVVCAYAVLFLLQCFANFTFFTAKSPLIKHTAIPLCVIGAVLISFHIFVNKPWKRSAQKGKLSWRNILFFAFIVSMGTSTLIMHKYGLSDNIKAMAWAGIEMFCLCSMPGRRGGKTYMYTFIKIFIWIAGVYSLASVAMALTGSGYYPAAVGTDIGAGGLAWGRLFGMYADPNYGCVVSTVALLCTAYLFGKGRCNLYEKIVYSLFALLAVGYIALSGSRTGLACLLATCLVAAFVFAIFVLKTKNRKTMPSILISIVASCCITAISAGVVFGAAYVYEAAEPALTTINGGPLSNPWTSFSQGFAADIAKANNMASQNDVETSISQKLNSYRRDANANTNEAAGNSQVENTTATDEAHIGYLGRNDYSDVSNGRFGLWKGAAQIIARNPIFGVSYRNIVAYAQENTPDSEIATTGNGSMHNVFIEVATSQGVVGLVIWIAMLASFVINAIVGLKRALAEKNRSAYLDFCFFLALIAASIAAGMFYSELMYVVTILSGFFWYVIGFLPEQYSVKD